MQSLPLPRFRSHSTEELESVLGEQIAAREPLHAWPLSSVELLVTTDGKRFVYKVQCEPTVEPEFYTLAKTHLLPECRILQRDERQAALLFPFITAPTLREKPLDMREIVARSRAIVRQIGSIKGDVPVYRNLGTVAAWNAFAAETLEKLASLLRTGIFQKIPDEEVALLAQWTRDSGVCRAIEQTSQIINGDLKAEHVFCTEDGYRIIDWQRPYRAPGEIDLILLLESQQIPVHEHVEAASIGLRWFLFLHWAVEAKTNLLPDLPFFENWTQQAIARILALGSCSS